MPIRKTTNTCTVGPAFTSLEHLLVATTAALCDESVDFVVDSDENNNSNNNKLVLEQVTTDAWTTITTKTRSIGWMGAVRALSTSSRGSTTITTDAVAESWLEVANQTFVVSYQHSTKGTYTGTPNNILYPLYCILLIAVSLHTPQTTPRTTLLPLPVWTF